MTPVNRIPQVVAGLGVATLSLTACAAVPGEAAPAAPVAAPTSSAPSSKDADRAVCVDLDARGGQLYSTFVVPMMTTAGATGVDVNIAQISRAVTAVSQVGAGRLDRASPNIADEGERMVAAAEAFQAVDHFEGTALLTSFVGLSVACQTAGRRGPTRRSAASTVEVSRPDRRGDVRPGRRVRARRQEASGRPTRELAGLVDERDPAVAAAARRGRAEDDQHVGGTRARRTRPSARGRTGSSAAAGTSPSPVSTAAHCPSPKLHPAPSPTPPAYSAHPTGVLSDLDDRVFAHTIIAGQQGAYRHLTGRARKLLADSGLNEIEIRNDADPAAEAHQVTLSG